MIKHDKFYNRNQIVKEIGQPRSAVEKLVSDIKPIKLGQMLVYPGIDILMKLEPDNDSLKRFKANIGNYDRMIDVDIVGKNVKN